MAKAKAAVPAAQKVVAQKKGFIPAKKMTAKDAVAILIGAGVIVDQQKKVQTYPFGILMTDKIAKAGAVLDRITEQVFNEKKGEMEDVPVWKTFWMDKFDHKDAKAARKKKLAKAKAREAAKATAAPAPAAA